MSYIYTFLCNKHDGPLFIGPVMTCCPRSSWFLQGQSYRKCCMCLFLPCWFCLRFLDAKMIRQHRGWWADELPLSSYLRKMMVALEWTYPMDFNLKFSSCRSGACSTTWDRDMNDLVVTCDVWPENGGLCNLALLRGAHDMSKQDSIREESQSCC